MGQTATVLLVDDDDDVREVLRRSLERAGYVVLAAADGEAALEAADGHDVVIEAVVTDVAMPRLSGIETVARLRATRPSLPVIYMSGHVEEPGELGLLSDTCTFLQKPFSPAVLAEALRRAVGDRPLPLDPQAG